MYTTALNGLRRMEIIRGYKELKVYKAH